MLNRLRGIEGELGFVGGMGCKPFRWPSKLIRLSTGMTVMPWIRTASGASVAETKTMLPGRDNRLRRTYTDISGAEALRITEHGMRLIGFLQMADLIRRELDGEGCDGII